jgi:hypothetical protein
MSVEFDDHGPEMIDTNYLHNALCHECFWETVDWIEKVLKPITFDTVAFCGMSGALMAPTIARRMDAGLVLVRKNIESSHAERLAEGDRSGTNYIIIDDLVDQGGTVRHIIEVASDFLEVPGQEPEAIVLYGENMPEISKRFFGHLCPIFCRS